MDMAAILVKKSDLNKLVIPFDRRPHVRSGENCSSSFREGHPKITQFYTLYVAQGQGQVTLRDKILIIKKMFYYLNHTL